MYTFEWKRISVYANAKQLTLKICHLHVYTSYSYNV